MVDFVSKPLFGGAISVDLPRHFIDVRLVTLLAIQKQEMRRVMHEIVQMRWSRRIGKLSIRTV
jgi:hypothetical protein